MLIGISGKARSGKNTVGDMILYCIWRKETKQEDFGYDHFLKNLHVIKEYAKNNKLNLISFAYLLKKCISIFIPSTPEDYESTEFKNSTIDWLGMTVRELLQKFGTGIRESVDKHFWVKALFAVYNKNEDYIVTDVRFLTEADEIRNRNGIILRINREKAGAGNHISEIELDDYKFDYIIDNNNSLEELLQDVYLFCLKYKLI